MARIACLLVPNLLVAAEQRAHPELAGRPLAVASGTGGRAEVVAVSPEAERAGVRLGQALAQARAACAELSVRLASPALERAARASLRDVALSVSPRVEEVARGGGWPLAEAVVFTDASGVSRLFSSEAGFAGALVQRAGRLGLPACVAVAGSRGVAQLAARALALTGKDVHTVPPGADADFLAPQPVDLLAPDVELGSALVRLGIRRLGQLARLPSAALATRLGPAALELQALARGRPEEPPLRPTRDPRLEEAVELEFPVDRLEPLGFVLRGLLSRLLERLDVRGLACRDLGLDLGLVGGGCDDRSLSLAAPTLDVRTLLRRVLLDLEERPPRAPVERVSVVVEGTPPRHDQLDLFRPAGPAPARLERLLAELEVLCGEGRVGTPATVDAWRPDAFGLEPFCGSAAGAEERPEAPTGAALAVRALRPPLPAQVRAPHGPPQHVRSALANGRVVRAAGPWRTTGAWWTEGRRFAYDHYDVETEDGLVTRLRFDWIASRWEIDGVYD